MIAKSALYERRIVTCQGYHDWCYSWLEWVLPLDEK